MVKITIFGLTHRLEHRITRKLLKIDRYMLRGVWQALNCLSIHATYCMIIAGASPGETKMWAAVRENSDFLRVALIQLGDDQCQQGVLRERPSPATDLAQCCKTHSDRDCG